MKTTNYSRTTKRKILWDKNFVIRATQVSGHSLKPHFCMFEISQMKHNSLDCHNFFKNKFPLIAKFICSKFDTNQKKISC
jgi:hypothetical protein